MVLGYSVIRRTTYQSWSRVYRRLLHRPAHLVQHLRHHYHRKVQAQHLFQHQLNMRLFNPLFSLAKIPQTHYRWRPWAGMGRPIIFRSTWMAARIQGTSERVPDSRDSHARSLHEPFLEPLRQMASGNHRVHAHFPKDRNCEICQRTKITRVPWRKRTGETTPRAENVRDLITADHKFLSEGCDSRNNHWYAVVVQDLAAQWIQSFPCKWKESREFRRSLQKFFEPTREAKSHLHWQFLGILQSLWRLILESLNVHISPLRDKRQCYKSSVQNPRRIFFGIVAIWLGRKRWTDSMECCCYLRNLQDLLSDGKTLYERRFGESFKGQVIPFGSMVAYHPVFVEDQSRIHQFGKKVLPGIFFGYVLHAGGIWKGDTEVADFQELVHLGAPEIHARLNAKEVINRTWVRNSCFQSQMEEYTFFLMRSSSEDIHFPVLRQCVSCVDDIMSLQWIRVQNRGEACHGRERGRIGEGQLTDPGILRKVVYLESSVSRRMSLSSKLYGWLQKTQDLGAALRQVPYVFHYLVFGK